MDLESITNTIINADCLDILRQLPDQCIDLILTDPPYGINSAHKISKNRKGGKALYQSGLNYGRRSI